MDSLCLEQYVSCRHGWLRFYRQWGMYRFGGRNLYHRLRRMVSKPSAYNGVQKAFSFAAMMEGKGEASWSNGICGWEKSGWGRSTAGRTDGGIPCEPPAPQRRGISTGWHWTRRMRMFWWPESCCPRAGSSVWKKRWMGILRRKK